jgi:RTX calcium-binding nonapeptide repeat (4 copies)
MDDKLFKAILAMDSYNRGYNEAVTLPIVLNQTQIGSATIIAQSDKDPANTPFNASFYAIAYQYNSQTTISYRGTDALTDVTTGWLLGGGNYNAPQGGMAIDFYKAVATQLGGSGVNLQTVNISLTGHSLGGGLAGYVASLYGKSANVFDSMNYADAATNVHFYASLSPSDPQYLTVAKPLIDSIYNGHTPIWDVNGSGVAAQRINGEAISFFDPLAGIVTNMHPAAQSATPLSLGPDVTGLTPVQLHSMATFVIRDYADLGGAGGVALATDWNSSAKYFWPELYDTTFAGQFIAQGKVQGTMDANSDWSGILRTVLAYSAIDSGTTVFGNTGIKAFYDDANNLGKAISGATVSQTLVASAKDVSKAFVQFTGELALNKVLQSAAPNVVNGVLTFADVANNHTLSVDFGDALWKSANNGTLPDMPGRDAVVEGILSRTTLAGQNHYVGGGPIPTIDDNHKMALALWGGDGSDSVFERVVFSLNDSGASQVPVNPNATAGHATLFAGGGGADVITGSTGDEMIFGGAGNDTIIISKGKDFLIGGLNTDTIDFSGLTTAVTLNSNIYQTDGINTYTYDTAYHSASGIFYNFEKVTLTAQNDTVDNKIPMAIDMGTGTADTVILHGDNLIQNHVILSGGTGSVVNADIIDLQGTADIYTLGNHFGALSAYYGTADYAHYNHALTFNIGAVATVSDGTSSDTFDYSGVSYVGSNYDCTFNLSASNLTCWTGTGNDKVIMAPALFYHGNYTYTGGIDSISESNGTPIGDWTIYFGPDIKPGDVHFQDTNLRPQSGMRA